MSLSRISAKDRDEWLKLRLSQGIGGSEAAACVGLSPWKTPLELWKEKTGVISEKDLSDKESVSRGVRLEPALRELYRALHPEYNVEYYKYDLLFQSERPWLFATLDGEIVTEDGTRGISKSKLPNRQTPQSGRNGPTVFRSITIANVFISFWQPAMLSLSFSPLL